MVYPTDPKQNHLLASLSSNTLARIFPHLESVSMPMGWVIHESGSLLNHMYFPTTSIVSLLQVMINGNTAEIALVGRDGVLGISHFMGSETMTTRAVVQRGGYGYRIRASILKQEFANGGELQLLMLRYMHALITQMAQTAVCNRHHTIEQQLCRWLLANLDRLPGNDLLMTQELIASTLGVRREGINEAAVKLQSQGMIRYNRGRITVLDRKQLESHVCECYAVLKKEYDRMLVLGSNNHVAR
jgi:CRP-like cAMP-binding protein